MLRIIVLFLMIGLVESTEAADFTNFDRHFVDATMRIDLHHGGDAKDENVSVDRVYRQGTWAGSRVHLLDPFPVGRYVVEVSDPAGGPVLFSRRYDSYFGEYRTTTGAAKGVRRVFGETVLIPFPRAKVRVSVKVRLRDQSHKTLLTTDVDPAAPTICKESLIGDVKVFDVHRSGDPHAKVDVAIVAEGYTAAEEAKLRADLDRFGAILFSQEPFKSSKDRFNVRGVWLPSEQSGSDEPGRGIWRRTAIGTTFDSLGSERYLLTEDNRAFRDAAAHVPYDAIYIMVNQARYGGGGIYNLFCTFTSDNQWAPYVFLHEFGHSFAGLADEYYTSSVAYNDFYPKGVEPNEPNITALIAPSPLKWLDLVSPGTPVPTPWEKAEFDAKDTAYQKLREGVNAKIASASREGATIETINTLKAEAERLSLENSKDLDAYLARSPFFGKVGAFEGAGYASKGMYRPSLDCIMFSKGTKPFCPVCARAIHKMIEHFGE